MPLIREAAAALDGLSRRPYHTGPDDLVFPGAVGGHFDDGHMRRSFAAALARAGLPPMRFPTAAHRVTSST